MSQLTSTPLPHHYAVYGLILASSEEIPGLDAAQVDSDQPADIRIVLGLMPEQLQQVMPQHPVLYFAAAADETGGPAHVHITTAAAGRYYHFTYAEGAEFLLDTHAWTVACGWTGDLTLRVAALYLLGPVLGFLLRLRGTTCLHASGILVNDGALAITGSSGAGKSTLAAAFAAAGWPVLTDDILPLAADDTQIYAQPGYGRLRLYPTSFQNRPGLPNELPELAPGWDKYYLDLAANNFKQHRAPARLKVIYIIDWISDERIAPSISPVPGATAVATLATHTYRNELLSPSMRMQEFYFLSTLAERVAIRRLLPVNDITALPLLCDMLLEDFERVTLRGQFRSERAQHGTGQ